MFKKALALVSLVVAAYSFNASAQFTRCEIDTEVKSFDFGIELGGGSGQATCWDVSGRAFNAPLTVDLNAGVGLQIGLCDVTAHYSAAGVGFALGDLLSAMAQVEVAPVSGRGGAFGVDLSPLGINAMLTISRVDVKNCAKILDIKGQIVSQAGPLTPLR